MSFFDIISLSLRNLREAKLRSGLTTMGVIVGVAMIVTMVSFGLGLQRNTVARFKELDLFNEVTVFGRSLSSLVEAGFNKRSGEGNSNAAKDSSDRRRGTQPHEASARVLNEQAVDEIAKIPGVVSVEPNISFLAYVRANERARARTIGGALVPNPATRFKEFAAGGMISAPDALEAVVDEDFVRDFGYGNARDALGQTLSLLAPPTGSKSEKDEKDEDDQLSFFGIPLEDEEGGDADGLVARSFRIVGVLKEGESGASRFRGMSLAASIYIPLPVARAWSIEHQDDLGQIATRLARETGALGENESGGYTSAIVRVSDPVLLTDVRRRLTEMGFSSFAIVDRLEQLRTVFLIINSALGLLGGISLLVASFGIANTMIMSILERTREIGIMKAIGAEDTEIKLIFFIEAAVIGLVGGTLGTLAAWGIDAAANQLAYRFVLQPQGASRVDFFALPPYLWLGAILFAVVVSIVAALYPAARAARIDPVKALRHD
ncbi:MAG TPA: ABC transporter permease [Pyrinomonadaceae bacterium]|jgi:ABC-type antimicrobial peptide transport system permease subunit